jgi:hypothetical protein
MMRWNVKNNIKYIFLYNFVYASIPLILFLNKLYKGSVSKRILICILSYKLDLHISEMFARWHTLVAIGTDCTGSCKSNYYTIMTMTVPQHAYRI